MAAVIGVPTRASPDATVDLSLTGLSPGWRPLSFDYLYLGLANA